jgi:Family of unknown function (DUF6290)
MEKRMKERYTINRSKMISIRLNVYEMDRLGAYATIANQTVSEIVRQQILNLIEQKSIHSPSVDSIVDETMVKKKWMGYFFSNAR